MDHRALSSADIEDLRGRLRGPVLAPGEPGYDDCRTVWNATVDARPGAIARCCGTADVVASVSFARERELLLAVRGGGHNVAGLGVCDGGLMLDLSLMNQVIVDARGRRAKVQGGAVWGAVDRETQLHGLAVPSGIVSTTGVGGLTLGGGMGWLSRMHGLTIDSLLGVELVTAAGEVIEALDETHPELLWGLRGGGGNFGVVTWFEFQLHQVGPDVLFGPTIYALDDAAEVLRNYRAFTADSPRECCAWVDLLTAPALPFLPTHVHGTKVISVIQCYAGDPQRGRSVLAGLRDFGSPLADAVMLRPYVEAQSIADGLYKKGLRNYWKAHNLLELEDSATEVLVERAHSLPTPLSDIMIHQLGGAISDVDPSATAYAHRKARFAVTPASRWNAPDDDAACIRWVRETYEALAPHALGTGYANFIGDESGSESHAYGANLTRLRELKRRIDPDNLFSRNQNVLPA